MLLGYSSNVVWILQGYCWDTLVMLLGYSSNVVGIL